MSLHYIIIIIRNFPCELTLCNNIKVIKNIKKIIKIIITRNNNNNCKNNYQRNKTIKILKFFFSHK